MEKISTDIGIIKLISTLKFKSNLDANGVNKYSDLIFKVTGHKSNFNITGSYIICKFIDKELRLKSDVIEIVFQSLISILFIDEYIENNVLKDNIEEKIQSILKTYFPRVYKLIDQTSNIELERLIQSMIKEKSFTSSTDLNSYFTAVTTSNGLEYMFSIISTYLNEEYTNIQDIVFRANKLSRITADLMTIKLINDTWSKTNIIWKLKKEKNVSILAAIKEIKKMRDTLISELNNEELQNSETLKILIKFLSGSFLMSKYPWSVLFV